jgi:hypothetical protein
MMYYGPGMSGWGMIFMIIGNLVLWGLLIFGAVLVARYVWPGQTASSSPAPLVLGFHRCPVRGRLAGGFGTIDPATTGTSSSPCE